MNKEPIKLKDFIDKQEIEENKNKEDIEKLLSYFNDKDGLGSDDNARVLAALLNLPEEDFLIMSGIFLNSLEKSVKDPSQKALLKEELLLTGDNPINLNLSISELSDLIDREMGDFSQNKKDFIKSYLSILSNAITEVTQALGKTVNIQIELCDENAKIPTYANKGDAGADIYAIEDVDINPGETKLIRTGIKIAVPYGYEAQIRPKSGLSLKTKMRISNTPGTIDALYRDEVGIIIDNIEPPIKDITYEFDENGRPIITSILHGSPIHITKGQKIAQLLIKEIVFADFFKVDDINIIKGNRGGGFGSTGKF